MTTAALQLVEREVPRLSQSVGWTLLSKSPRHAWRAHRLLGGTQRTPTASMDTGTLVHELTLGGDRVVVVDAKDWRTNDAKEARDLIRSQGKVPILNHKYAEAEVIAKTVTDRLAQEGIILADGFCEEKLQWEQAGVACEGTPDFFDPEQGAIVLDLKVTEKSADPDTIQRSMVSGWAMQRSAYIGALEYRYPELVGRWEWIWAVVEVETHEVALYEAGASFEQLGDMQWQRALATWRRLLEQAGPELEPFPGYGRRTLEAPGWAMAREEDHHHANLYE